MSQGKYELNYTPPKTVRQFMLCDDFFRLLIGPIGSGKSVGSVIEILRRCIQMPQGPDGYRRSRWAVIRNCYDDQTEILTERRGWLKFAELCESDKVATRVDGELTFEKPSYYYAAPYKGDMVTIKSNAIDLCVTPEHELWVSPRVGRGKKWQRYEHRKANEIFGIGELYRCTNRATWKGERPVQSLDFFEFLGFWYAEGFANTYKRSDCSGFHYRLVVSQKVRADGYVEDLLRRNGFDFGVCDKGNGNYNYNIYLNKRVKTLIKELQTYGLDTYTRYLPEYVKNAPPEYIRAFLKGYTEGDGSSKRCSKSVDRLYTSSKRLADDLQELIIRIGGASRLSVRKRTDKAFSKYERAPQYILTIRQPDRCEPVIQKHHWGRQPYDGMVYCVTVSSHVVLVRRNGNTAWCGQTRPQLKDTTIQTFFQWIKPGILGRWKESEMIFYMEFSDVRAEILFRALDTPEDVQKVLSLEISGAWLNESREIPLAIIEALQGRIGRYPSRKDVPSYWCGMIADTNPPEIDSEWWKIAEGAPIEEDNDNSIITCTTYKQPSGLSDEAENKENLRPNYYEDLAKGKTQQWVDVYIHGKYAMSQAGKPVYIKTFKYEKHIVPTKIMGNLPVIIGMDCARTPAATFLQVTYDGRIQVQRELYAFDMGAKDFIKMKLKPMIQTQYPTSPLIFIGDPAWVRQNETDDNSWYKMLKEAFPRQEGHTVKPSITNDPTARITALDTILYDFPGGDPRIVIDPCCKFLIEALRSKYRYAKMRGMDGKLHDKPEKNQWSHVAESLQYGVMFAAGKNYDPSDYVRATFNPLNNKTTFRPADPVCGY